MSSITSIGLSGYKDAIQRAYNASEEVNSAFTSGEPEGAVSGFINLASAKREAQASVKIIKVGDEMMGAILDIIG